MSTSAMTTCKFCKYDITRDIAGNWWHLRTNTQACTTVATPKDTYYEPLWPTSAKPTVNIDTEICHECKAMVLPSQIGMHEAWHTEQTQLLNILKAIQETVVG